MSSSFLFIILSGLATGLYMWATESQPQVLGVEYKEKADKD